MIAGDFNLNAQWVGDDAWYNKIEQSILNTFTMWGMRDLIADSGLPSSPGCRCGGEECRHVQTNWLPRSHTPWQNDHALASPGLAVSDVWVDSAAVVDHALSDHAPIVLDLSAP